MKRILFILMLAITATSIAGATDKGQRAKWFEEMRRYKSEYIAERLNSMTSRKQSSHPSTNRWI